MKDIEAYEKGKLIKETLKLVEILSKIEDGDNDVIIELIEKSKKITKNRFWKLT
jgi:hypothetical protein